jgi:hypothetical protein
MASGRQNSALYEASVPSDDPRRRLVQRILASQCFERSSRMRDLLAYICDRAFVDPQTGICEQEIGCAVFGRTEGYDTNQDNIVRVNVSQLRKRLETYFGAEGEAEPLTLELPKGHYVPVFQPRSAPPPSEPPLPQPAAAHSAPPRRLTWALGILSGVLAVLSLALGVALLSRESAPAHPPTDTAASNALWSRLIRTGQTTDIVLTDSSLGLTQDLMGRAIPLSEYLRPNIWQQAPGLAGQPDAERAARFVARRRHTDMASVNASRDILALVSSTAHARVSFCFARDFDLQRMKTDNAILLGSRRTNPWVELVENRMNFRFGFDASTRQAWFENPHPQPGEAQVYANDPSTSYCQILFVPNLGATGNLMVISGTDPEGTETGAEFLTRDAGLASLQKALHADQLPFFEVLLKSVRVGGAISGSEIVASRRIQANP